MLYYTSINDTKVEISAELVKKYDRPAPRYTSYPTAPLWTSSFGPDNYISSLKHLNTQTLKHLSLYFHIPFCDKRCRFCGCSTIATSRHEVAGRYILALGKELELIANCLDTTRPVAQLHFGGGTPTYLSCNELEKLWGFITKHFKFTQDAEISIEVDPRITTNEHIRTLRKLGFGRISLGVQDFSEKVQKAVGRIETFGFIRKFADDCRREGFKSVNIDLVYGLPYQTLPSFKDTVQKVIELSPDRVACFNFAYLPAMLPHQRMLDKEAMPNGSEKFAIFCQTIEQFSNAGYDFIGMDHFAKSQDELSIAAKNKTLWRNFQGYTTKAGTDLIGFGLTAISDVSACYAQNAKKLADYYRAIENGKLATVKGWKLSGDDLARRKIIRELFCNGCADMSLAVSRQPSAVSNFCNRRPTTNGSADQRLTTNDLLKDSLIRLSGNMIQVTPLGRLFIRNIAMAFDAYIKQGEAKFSRTV